ncbi:hypothetical protein [Coleofasciculus sp.]|uniref:hypothetical protein n=1 Tax=Coleofasciculus sp. TaxID=3100458 RepID=UPI0039F8E7BD
MIAITTESFISAPIDQNILVNELVLAASRAGLGEPIDAYASGTDKFLVFQITQDIVAAYGKVYLRWQIRDDRRIYADLFSDWTVATHSGVNSSGNYFHSDLDGTQGIKVCTVNGGAEFQLVIISQGTRRVCLGGISPDQKPDWWSLNSWNYYFVPDFNDYRRFRTTTLNPYGNVYHDVNLNNPRMKSANIYTGRRDILRGILFFSQSGQGISGRSSDSLASASTSGTNLFNILDIPESTEQFLVLHDGSEGGGLCCQISE